ncbi:MAG TPA: capsule assembly Wzi family protein [Terracidiphilus sp.]|nr:capsule assembly Wzi family protein [Terracidiphilus sp.]
MNRKVAVTGFIQCVVVLAGLVLITVGTLAAELPGAPASVAQAAGGQNDADADCESYTAGSPYIPVDSWVYPAVLRLYSLGYVDTVYLGMRPWTRGSLGHMLSDTADRLEDAEGVPGVDEAQGIYDALMRELRFDTLDTCQGTKGMARIESAYNMMRGISGTALRDSYHIGSTIINDYGRPYAGAFNNYVGASGYATSGRFAVYVRGELQGATSATGYSTSLAQALSTVDGTLYLNTATGKPYNQATIPMGPINSTFQFRLIEAYVSAQYLNHVFSFGKQDEWLGPALGSSMAYSNNAENIYAFHINRIEPLDIPLLSKLTGPFRYEFLVGPLRGHTFMPNPDYVANPSPSVPNVTNPGDPWVHVEKISFRPTSNLEFGFERTAIWGGKGHGPITMHSFLKSFFSAASPSGTIKFTREDPGARFGAFDFSYRLPFLRNWLTLYSDSEVHDDVSPIDAPRRASYRPGLYLSHVPGIPKLDIRAEAASTDPSHSDDPSTGQYPSQYGHFMYWEFIQKQGYTNQGQLFGDWIGREDKGGQAWITYHLSGNEWIQVSVRNQKATKNFIPGSTTQTFTGPGCPLTSCLVPGGTTLNEINFQMVKRIGKDFEINGNLAYEHWKAPVYLPGQQSVATTTIQLTWFPERKVSF